MYIEKMFPKINLIEPQRWVYLLQKINWWASSSDLLFNIVSFFSDAIVFTFPIILLLLYFLKNKTFALRIFFSTVVAALINIILQLFLDKPRPETAIEWTWWLLLPHLPTMSFPSDHAAVAMAFWVAFYFFWKTYITKKEMGIYKILWTILILWAITMSICRVAVWVHRPTDIIAGRFFWSIAVIIINYFPNIIFKKLIALQEYLFSFFRK